MTSSAIRSAIPSRAFRIAVAAALGVFGACVAHEPSVKTNNSELTAALDQLQSGDAAAAAKRLRRITDRDMRNPQAWRALGTAYQRLHKPDQAIRAFTMALKIEPEVPRVFYALGTLFAQKHDPARAFAWLGRARRSRRVDMTQLTEDPALASLRHEPGFGNLLPQAAEFDHPFVEDVKIIREWQGEAGNDQFGWIARRIGDVDGDGIADIVTSAPTHGAHAGRVYVYSVGTGAQVWVADGRAGDELGTGIEAAGDTNGDGIPDVVASGPGGTGVAYIYSGRDGRVLQHFQSSDSREEFGRHVSGAGDLNHDGYADVIIGAPGKADERRTSGHAYVYSGRDGALLLSVTGERAGDEFGSAVAAFDSGKLTYLIVGAAHGGPQRHGRVYVYEGTTPAPKFVIESDGTGSALGAMFVAGVGDMDGDGVPDFYVSDWSNSAKGHSTGRIYVFSGKTGARLLALTGEGPGDGFGTSPSHAGDVDGDGHADLIVGAWQYGGAADSGGRAYLYSGKDGRLLRRFTDRVPGDTFGFDAVGMGDVDGDGTVDFLITAAWSGVHGYHSGRVFLISSGVAVSPATH
jgi:FG-GAP repeat/Tetratricopeptide repeat